MWKVVIQDANTCKYLSDSGEWTLDLKSARDFQRVREAAKFCMTLDLRGLRLVMGIPDEDGRFTSTSKTVLPVPRVRSMSLLLPESERLSPMEPGVGTEASSGQPAPGSPLP